MRFVCACRTGSAARHTRGAQRDQDQLPRVDTRSWLIADEIDRLGEAPDAMKRVVTQAILETVDTDLWRAGIPLRDLPIGSDAFNAVLDWADQHLSVPATA